jgi:DNA-directed RNA polymerase subunit L
LRFSRWKGKCRTRCKYNLDCLHIQIPIVEQILLNMTNKSFERPFYNLLDEEIREKITVSCSKSSDNSAYYFLRDEDHTVGNMLTSVLTDNDSVQFVSYNMPDSDKRNIILHISSSSLTFPVVKKGADDLADTFSLLKVKLQKLV